MKTKRQTIGGYLTGILLLSTIFSCQNNHESKKSAFAYTDSIYKQGIQIIPGRIQCEYYNLGGAGIAYHDSDSSNNGSGRLNKGEDYLSTFRKDEGVDISFTKFHNSIDNSLYNLVEPEEGQLYVGWTEPGEWIKYTVDVQTPGIYQLALMYTANNDGQISIAIEDQDISGPLNVRSTYDAADNINWRQWHHWNREKNLGEVVLKEGIQTLTLHTVTRGQMNYDYLEFTLKDQK